VRIGLFGGSFDPPHVGHWLAAVDALDALALDRIDFIPTATQPLKAGDGHATSAAQRLTLVTAMVADEPRFAVNPVEVERGGLSFTVDTVATYRAASVDDHLFLLLGADAAAGLARWREPERLLSMVTLVVLTRGVGEAPSAALPETAVVLPTRRVDVSSTEVRRRVRDGRSVRGFVLDAVAEQIRELALYR
jgi:nicotinate-nucleotide adenylyltransferase